jgi:hypothetical protein
MTDQTRSLNHRSTKMDWYDQPATESAQPPPDEPATSAFGGIRRTIATIALAAGLLAVGGTAVVLAADPSTSPAPAATTQPSAGTGGSTAPKTHTGNCPNMGGSGSRGSGGSTAPSTTGPTSSPAL